MTKRNRKNSILLTFVFFFILGCAGKQQQIEPWVQTDDLVLIKIEMTTTDVRNILGEPLFIEKIKDDDEIIEKYFYNFRTKQYSNEVAGGPTKDLRNTQNTWGRRTNIQFTFINDELISWEEDKMTLALAERSKTKTTSVTQYLLLLLNLILVIKIL